MNDQVKIILNENVLGVLATVNEDGSPWATPLHLVSDDTYVYWFSHESCIHSRNVARDSRASIAIFSPDESQGVKGVYLRGTIQQLLGNEREQAVTVFKQRFGQLPAVFSDVPAYRLEIGTRDEQKSTGSCWYFYS